MEEEKERSKFILSLWEDNGGSVRFLTSIMQKATDFIRHLDSQTNVLVSISSAIFLLVVSRVYSQETINIPLLILGSFAGISALVSLYAIHPPRFMRNKRQEESLMYNKKVANFASHVEYKC